MRRRIILGIFLVLWMTPSAWAKFKEDEQKYLDDQFKMVLDQAQALGNQVAALSVQLSELKANQAQLLSVIKSQQHQLQDMEDMLSSLRMGNEDNFGKLKTAITDLRTQTENAMAKLAAAPAVAPGGVTPVAPVTPTAAREGYITTVEGTNVTIDMGSAQGLQKGSQLAVFKAADRNTRVGIIEVTQVTDAGNSHARIVTVNPGVKLEFSDVVRIVE